MYIYICIIYVYILKPSCRSYNPMIFHLKLLRAISAMICHQLFKEKHVTTLFCPIGKFWGTGGSHPEPPALGLHVWWGSPGRLTTEHEGHGDLKFQIPQCEPWCWYIFSPTWIPHIFLWPSFVGTYSSTMVRIWDNFSGFIIIFHMMSWMMVLLRIIVPKIFGQVTISTTWPQIWCPLYLVINLRFAH